MKDFFKHMYEFVYIYIYCILQTYYLIIFDSNVAYPVLDYENLFMI